MTLAKSLPRGAKLFTFEYRRFKEAFEKAQKKLALPTVFILYQLRHGGASHDRAKGYRNLVEVKQRLRVTADSTLRRCEAHARMQQVERRLSDQQLAQADTIAKLLPLRFRDAFSAVPQRPPPGTSSGARRSSSVPEMQSSLDRPHTTGLKRRRGT